MFLEGTMDSIIIIINHATNTSILFIERAHFTCNGNNNTNNTHFRVQQSQHEVISNCNPYNFMVGIQHDESAF